MDHVGPKQALGMVDSAIRRIDESSLAICQQDVFDTLYSFATTFSKLDAPTKSAVVRAVSSGLSDLVSRVSVSEGAADSSTARNALKMYTYLATEIVADAEAAEKADSMVRAKKRPSRKARAASGFTWVQGAESIACALAEALAEPKVFSLWRMSQPDAGFKDAVFKAACQMMENPDNTRSASVRSAVLSIMHLLVTRCGGFSERLAPAVLHLLHNFEFLSGPMAELVAGFVKGNPDVVAGVLREIGRMDSALISRDTAAAKSISAFVTELATREPDAVLSGLSLLLSHLDGESYVMRNGVISTLGSIIEAKMRLGDTEGSSASNNNDDDKENQENENPSSFNAAAGNPTPSKKPLAGARPSDEKWTTTRASLMSILRERTRDVSSYTRSRALKVWTALAEGKALGEGEAVRAVSVAVDRLSDKAVQVRKRAVALLTILLQYNPFGCDLDQHRLTARMQQLEEVIKAKLQVPTAAEAAAAGPSDGPQEVVLEVDGETVRELKRVSNALMFLKKINGGNDVNNNTSGDVDGEAGEKLTEADEKNANQDTKQDEKVPAPSAMQAMCSLLRSKTASDVLEAIKFFLVAAQFRVCGAQIGVKSMLSLVWSKNAGIRDAVLGAYHTLYLASLEDAEGVEARRHAVVIARQLIDLMASATLSEKTSFGEVLLRLAMDDRIPQTLLDALRNIVAAEAPGAAALTEGAIEILGMLGAAQPRWILSHLAPVIRAGFSDGAEWTAEQLSLARAACLALRLTFKAKDARPTATHRKLLVAVFSRVQSLLLLSEEVEVSADASADAKRAEGDAWYPAAEQAVAAVFALHPDPNAFFQDVLGSVMKRVADGEPAGREGRLARFMFLCGHVMIKLLVHLEETEAAIKRSRSTTDKKRKAERKRSGGGSSTIEEDMAVGASRDYELEMTRESIERGLLDRTTLLGSVVPAIVQVCSSPARFRHPALVPNAVLCLCKFMCASATFCEQHLRLLFTLLGKSKNPLVRRNLVVAIGDLAFRFPNLVEPWSMHLYQRLDDADDTVRKNTLMVLMHLILNDMVKMKGPISEISKRLYDSNPRIASLVRVLFSELAQKGKNPIYNLLPDTLSRLSSEVAQGKLPRKEFRGILQFLLGFITRERHTESLVEKLCHRFKTTDAVTQWRDLAYCLAHIHHSDKSVKKLMEMFSLFKDRLTDDEVVAHFGDLHRRARKLLKQQDVRTQFDAFLARVERGEGHADDAFEFTPAVGDAKKFSRGRRGRAKKKKKAAAPVARRPRRRRRAKAKVVEESDDESAVELLSEGDFSDA